MGNLWFPVGFPLNQSIEIMNKYQQLVKLMIIYDKTDKTYSQCMIISFVIMGEKTNKTMIKPS